MEVLQTSATIRVLLREPLLLAIRSPTGTGPLEHAGVVRGLLPERPGLVSPLAQVASQPPRVYSITITAQEGGWPHGNLRLMEN